MLNIGLTVYQIIFRFDLSALFNQLKLSVPSLLPKDPLDGYTAACIYTSRWDATYHSKSDQDL